MNAIASSIDRKLCGALPGLPDLSISNVADEFVRKVPISFARRFGVLGVRSANGVMPVAVTSPASYHALDKITTLLGVATEPIPAESELVQKLINEAYGAQESGIGAVITGLEVGSAKGGLNL